MEEDEEEVITAQLDDGQREEKDDHLGGLWSEHRDDDGTVFFENCDGSGETTWELPEGATIQNREDQWQEEGEPQSAQASNFSSGSGEGRGMSSDETETADLKQRCRSYCNAGVPPLWKDLLRASAIVFLLVHPTVSEVVLLFFHFQKIDGIDRLSEDLEVTETSPEWQSHSVLAYLAFVFYVIGVPVYMFTALCWGRMQAYDAKTRSSMLRFLCAKKKKHRQRRGSTLMSELKHQSTAASELRKRHSDVAHLHAPVFDSVDDDENHIDPMMYGGVIYDTLGFAFVHYECSKSVFSQYWECIRVSLALLLSARLPYCWALYFGSLIVPPSHSSSALSLPFLFHLQILRKFGMIAISVFISDPNEASYLGLALLCVNVMLVAWVKPFKR